MFGQISTSLGAALRPYHGHRQHHARAAFRFRPSTTVHRPTSHSASDFQCSVSGNTAYYFLLCRNTIEYGIWDQIGIVPSDVFETLLSTPVPVLYFVPRLIAPGAPQIPPRIDSERRLTCLATTLPSAIGHGHLKSFGNDVSADLHPQSLVLYQGKSPGACR